MTNDQAKNILVFTFQYGSTLIGNTSGGSTIIANFTFQYGSTLMLSKRILSAPNASFTFQYGSTLIGVGNKPDKGRFNLHSNMVLLNAEGDGAGSGDDSFTFQYGSTLMVKFPLLSI